MNYLNISLDKMGNNKNQQKIGKERTTMGMEYKWLKIQKIGKETEINLFVVVEMFRFLFYLWFVLIMIVGILLTILFTKEDYSAIIKMIFGSVNVCVFFDFPPATYVLPSLYALWPIIVFQYTIVSIFRAWIATEENKMSRCAFILYSMAFVYFSLSSAIFATSLAVQPSLENPETIMLHTLPFTNLVMALTCLQIAITWFGFKVSWKGLSIPKVLQFVTYVCLIALIITSSIKIIQHINGLGRGLLWNVRNEIMGRICQIVDAVWLLSALFWPMGQSGYLMWRKFDTHGLVITIGDNRDANSRTGSSLEHQISTHNGIEVLPIKINA